MANKWLNYVESHADVQTTTERTMLMAIANHANAQGYCWLSRDTLAQILCLENDRSIPRIAARLEKAGLLRRVARQRSNGSDSSNGYQLLRTPARRDDRRVTHGMTPGTPAGMTPGTRGGMTVESPPLGMTVESPLEPLYNPPLEPTVRTTTIESVVVVASPNDKNADLLAENPAEIGEGTDTVEAQELQTRTTQPLSPGSAVPLSPLALRLMKYDMSEALALSLIEEYTVSRVEAVLRYMAIHRHLGIGFLRKELAEPFYVSESPVQTVSDLFDHMAPVKWDADDELEPFGLSSDVVTAWDRIHGHFMKDLGGGQIGAWLSDALLAGFADNVFYVVMESDEACGLTDLHYHRRMAAIIEQHHPGGSIQLVTMAQLKDMRAQS
jgi:hypothetical protein